MAQNSDNGSSRFKVDFNLTNNQKNFFAALLSGLTLVVIIGVFVLIFSGNPENDDDNNQTSGDVTEILTGFDQTLSGLEPGELFYDDVTFEDLDIYPSAWVERNFTTAEAANELISGPGADPDQDLLSNKLEFIYGSNPNNPDSLCDGELDDDLCKGRNDKENVDAGISPLTGLSLDEELKVFRINFQDQAVIETLEESFDNASREGLDFPTLYQLSKTVDNTEAVSSITVVTTEETRENLLEYIEFRIDLVEEIIGNDELQSLSQIYSLISIPDLERQLAILEAETDRVANFPVPESEAESHKLYVYIFQRLTELVEIRLGGLQNDTLDTEAYQEEARRASVDIVWAYRQLNDAGAPTIEE